MCRDEYFYATPNKQADRLIRNLQVFCANKEKGCKWQGELNSIMSHLTTECLYREANCQYCNTPGEHQSIEGQHKEKCSKFPLPCPNNCSANSIPRDHIDEHKKVCPLEDVICPNNCGAPVQRHYMTSHLETECMCRKVECQHCHITGEYHFVEYQHKEECPKLPLLCPNNCAMGNIPRNEIKNHLKVCPSELIQCEYHIIGCKVRIACKDQKSHNKQMLEQHLLFTKQHLVATQENLAMSQLEAVNSRENLAAKIT